MCSLFCYADASYFTPFGVDLTMGLGGGEKKTDPIHLDWHQVGQTHDFWPATIIGSRASEQIVKYFGPDLNLIRLMSTLQLL